MLNETRVLDKTAVASNRFKNRTSINEDEDVDDQTVLLDDVINFEK